MAAWCNGNTLCNWNLTRGFKRRRNPSKTENHRRSTSRKRVPCLRLKIESRRGIRGNFGPPGKGIPGGPLFLGIFAGVLSDRVVCLYGRAGGTRLRRGSEGRGRSHAEYVEDCFVMGEERSDLGDGIQPSGNSVLAVHETNEDRTPVELRELRRAYLFGDLGDIRNAAHRLLYGDHREDYIATYPEYVLTGDLREGPWQQAVRFVGEAVRARQTIAALNALFVKELFPEDGYQKPEGDYAHGYSEGRHELVTELSLLIGKAMSDEGLPQS